MKKVVVLFALFTSVSFSQIISFNNPSDWKQGSGSFDSYQIDHEYTDFIESYKINSKGYNGLRETNGFHDGYSKTYNNSNYAWNIKSSKDAYLFIKIEASDIDGFSFYVRRWEDNSNLRYAVTLSTDGGILSTILGTFDNNFFDGTSDWKKYEYNSHIKTDSPELPIIIKIEAYHINPILDGESILIDDFSVINPLPVELTTFTASVVDDMVKLNWETATEVNNYGFEVARLSSPEQNSAESNWETVGFVNGHGNSNSTKHYSFIDNSMETSGKYFYRLKQIDIDGSFEYSEVVEIDIDLNLPIEFKLSQNFPNPFNPATTISFSIPPIETSQNLLVRLIVFNLIGEEVAELVNQYLETGYHNVEFNASKLNSGIYIYKLEVDNHTLMRKMILLK